MGFISFHLKFYKNELQKLKTAPADEDTIYRAKQLLKMLDDLLDEGYTELNEKLEEAYAGVSKLKTYLKENGAAPFPIDRKIRPADISYEPCSHELKEAIQELLKSAKRSKDEQYDAFFSKLRNFCQWIGYEEDTAYIFLLRDTLLPYLYFLNKKRSNIYPWLLSRKTLETLTGTKNVDDEIRLPIFKALEFGHCRNYSDFCDMVLPDMCFRLKKYPKIERSLSELLGEIREEKIIVVEAGCSGTFPMLLKSLDERVDFRMFTTYPYLLKIYGNKIFSSKYENNRRIETLYSQDLYLRFSHLKGDQFFVEKCNNKEIIRSSLAEVKAFLKFQKQEN